MRRDRRRRIASRSEVIRAIVSDCSPRWLHPGAPMHRAPRPTAGQPPRRPQPLPRSPPSRAPRTRPPALPPHPPSTSPERTAPPRLASAGRPPSRPSPPPSGRADGLAPQVSGIAAEAGGATEGTGRTFADSHGVCLLCGLGASGRGCAAQSAAMASALRARIRPAPDTIAIPRSPRAAQSMGPGETNGGLPSADLAFFPGLALPLPFPPFLPLPFAPLAAFTFGVLPPAVQRRCHPTTAGIAAGIAACTATPRWLATQGCSPVNAGGQTNSPASPAAVVLSSSCHLPDSSRRRPAALVGRNRPPAPPPASSSSPAPAAAPPPSLERCDRNPVGVRTPR